MRSRFALQVAGVNRVEQQLNRALRDDEYDRLRVLVAFARWSGIHLVDKALEGFAARGEIDVVVGIDLGGTTAEALEYLMRLPNTRVRIFRSGRPHVVFHPKAYAFDGESRWLSLMGSSNWTTGGMFTNVELVSTISGTAKETNPFDEIWSQVTNPRHPIEDHHLSLLDEDLLEALAPSLDRYTRRPPDRAGTGEGGVTPIGMAESPPQPGRPPDRRQQEPETEPEPSGQDVLYVEVWGETGGGTQVQFPKAAVRDYFGATAGQITWLTLDTPSGTETQRIQIFSNNTFRIPLRFLAGIGRPAVIRISRVAPDHYSVAVRSDGAVGYKAWLGRCDTQTRSDSKRYGMR